MRFLLFATVLVGCSNNTTTPTDAGGINRDIEPQITITQGIYGQFTFVSDALPLPIRVLPNTAFDAYAADGVTLVGSMTSDSDGIYQVTLAAGSYTVCSQGRSPTVDGIANPGGCLSITVGAGAIRQDWEATIGGGYWCPDGLCTDADR